MKLIIAKEINTGCNVPVLYNKIYIVKNVLSDIIPDYICIKLTARG